MRNSVDEQTSPRARTVGVSGPSTDIRRGRPSSLHHIRPPDSTWLVAPHPWRAGFAFLGSSPVRCPESRTTYTWVARSMVRYVATEASARKSEIVGPKFHRLRHG